MVFKIHAMQSILARATINGLIYTPQYNTEIFNKKTYNKKSYLVTSLYTYSTQRRVEILYPRITKRECIFQRHKKTAHWQLFDRKKCLAGTRKHIYFLILRVHERQQN